ncbi:MAG: TolC family protein [Dysgonamonadaceae bacterium]|jgi:outer membrane protein TolC|nr:TolC family protein [Dysgonamonadaceae bacterium]
MGTIVASGQEGLPFYLKTATENNPAVKAAFLAYKASLQKIPQAGAYEDPQLEMGFFLEPMDIVDGRQIAQFQLMQMFPWFGTKKAAQTEAQHMAKMAFEQFRDVKDNLCLEVYNQWYSLCEWQQKRINNEENKKLLQQLETLALQRISSGGNGRPTGGRQPATGTNSPAGNGKPATGGMSGMNMGNTSQTVAGRQSPAANDMSSMEGSVSSGMSDVLRIQLEIIELESNTESLLSEMTVKKARFNALLNLPAENEIVVPDELAQTPFSLDEKEIMQWIATQNPMLEMLNEEALAYEAKAEMDRKMSYPMFGIGLQYMLIGKSESAGNQSANEMAMDNMSRMNGKDMVMPMVSISIPIYRNKYKAARRESDFLRQASREKYADTFNDLQAELYRLKYQLEDMERKITLYRKQAGLASTTCDLAIQEFISGRNNLSDVIQIQRQLLEYQLKESEAIAEYNTSVAAIHKLAAQLK